MPIEPGSIGGIGLKSAEFKQIVIEVTEDAVMARQAAYDTVMEVLSKRVTGDDALAFAATLTDQQFAEIAAREPGKAAELLQALRERQENES